MTKGNRILWSVFLEVRLILFVKNYCNMLSVRKEDHLMNCLEMTFEENGNGLNICIKNILTEE